MMSVRKLSGVLLIAVTLFCGLALSPSAMADFGFDEMEQIDSAEQDDLLEQAKKAARSWSFGTAESYLKQAEQKGFAPDKVKAVRDVISSARSAKAAKERREEEQRQLAERQRRERAAAAARRRASTSGGGNRYSGKDMKRWCLGASGKYQSECYAINDKDIKSACIGMSKHQSECYAIKDPDIKRLCIARTKHQSECYAINNPDIKHTCIGITRHKSDCYNVKNGRWRLLCAGIAMTSNNCFNIE